MTSTIKRLDDTAHTPPTTSEVRDEVAFLGLTLRTLSLAYMDSGALHRTYGDDPKADIWNHEDTGWVLNATGMEDVRRYACTVLRNWCVTQFLTGNTAIAVDTVGWPTIGALLTDTRLPGRGGDVTRMCDTIADSRFGRYVRTNPSGPSTTRQIQEAFALMSHAANLVPPGTSVDDMPDDPGAGSVDGNTTPSLIQALATMGEDPVAVGMSMARQEPVTMEDGQPTVILGMLMGADMVDEDPQALQEFLLDPRFADLPEGVAKGLIHAYRTTCFDSARGMAGLHAQTTRTHATKALAMLYTNPEYRMDGGTASKGPSRALLITTPTIMLRHLQRLARYERRYMLKGQPFVVPVPGNWRDDDGDGRNDMVEDAPVLNFLNDRMEREVAAKTNAKHAFTKRAHTPAPVADTPEPHEDRSPLRL